MLFLDHSRRWLHRKSPRADAAIAAARLGCAPLALAFLLLVFGAELRPARAQAAEKALWGPTTLSGGASAFPLYRELGVDTLQISLNWAAVAPTRPSRPSDPADPAYRWPAALDAAVAEGRRNRVAIAVQVSGSPRWANGGRSSTWVPDGGAYAKFLTAASRRYGSVRRWMVWGEPNKGDRFQPNAMDDPRSARAYAPLLDRAYGALKSVSPRNVVIGGMTWTGGDVKPARFLRWMRLSDGRPPRLDWFGHNPFPFRFPNLREEAIGGGFRDMSDMDLFSREVARTYTRPCGRRRRCGRRPRLWLSEFTVLSDRRSKAFELSVSRRSQGRWLRAAYRIADGLPAVAGMGWYHLEDQAPRPDSSNWGLLTSGGKRKPSFFAFKRAPSRRFRPGVRVRGRIARTELARRGVTVRVRARAAGRTVIALRTSKGRVLLRTRARTRANRSRSMPLRRRRLKRGRYLLEVRAPRGELVRVALRLR